MYNDINMTDNEYDEYNREIDKSIASNKTRKVQEELDGLKKKLINIALIGVGLIILLLIIIPPFFRLKSGLYIVTACDDNSACYALQANVESGNGESSDRVETLFFNDGGSIDLYCVLPSKFLGFTSDDGICYEEEDTNNQWQIDLLKYLGDRRE